MPGYLLSWLCAGKKEGKEGGLKEKYGAGGGGGGRGGGVPGVSEGPGGRSWLVSTGKTEADLVGGGGAGAKIGLRKCV